MNPNLLWLKRLNLTKERGSINGYITGKTRKFQLKMVVNNTDGNLSADSGLILVKEFMDMIDFSKLAHQFLTFRDNRSYCFHDNISLLEQLLFQLIAG
ncbi:transposase [Desemzia sp. RIT 804]|uniref:transposase n=1 Tax=Desemzia sp. RIT 804 TaxID=2810209 RepID=UPI001F178BE3|nr:transposase [Desemzia sp. RIT 804]